MLARSAFCIGALALALSAGSAAAQPAPKRDKAAAQALFDQGQALMDAGDYATACPKLAESYQLDPAGGAILNLARCHQLQGRTATAWQEFKTAVSMARVDRREDREKFALEQIGLLEPKLSTLTISVVNGVSIDGLEVVRDGSSMGPASLGTALPIDLGLHEVEVRAPRHRSYKTTVTIDHEAESQTLQVPALELLPEPAPHPVDRKDAPSNGGQQVAGWSLVGIGGASVIGGTVTGALALSKRGSSNELCSTNVCPNNQNGRAAVDLNNQAKRLALSTDVLVGVGLALAGAGLVVALTAPHKSPSSVSLGVGIESLSVLGSF